MFASSVMDDAAALLNDQGKVRYTYAIQLSYLQMANDELIQKLAVNGISVLKKFSSVAVIASGASVFPIPVDMLLPEKMFERQAGSNDVFILMTEKQAPPEELNGTSLSFWSYRNLAITLGPANLQGALQAREVKLDYTRILTSITSSGTVVEIDASKRFLAQRTAGLCARYIGENTQRADQLDVISRGQDMSGDGGSLGELVALFVRNLQSFGVRRRSYRRQRILLGR
jgi:hypothetical protein